MVGGFLTDVVVVAVVLGVMIFVHELGHFVAAKGFGVRVITFSLGFGKRVVGWERGGTDYRVSLLPLGGYVKMAGDDPASVLHGDPSEFLSRPRWQRFVIVVMGPTMNVLLAIAVLAGLYKFHYEKPAYEDQPVEIGAIDPNSPAARAGLEVGDVVKQFDGLHNPKWEDVELKVVTDVGEAIPLEVSRGGQTLHLTITPKAQGPDRIGSAGWYPFVPAILDQVSPGSPASRGGLKPGDQIVGVNGSKMLFLPLIVETLRGSQGRPMSLTILRNGKEFNVEARPVYEEAMGQKIWRIGVTMRNTEYVVRRLPLGLAVRDSLRDNFKSLLATVDVLGKILTRQMSTRTLSGPIGIAQISGEAYRQGMSDLLTIMSFISLQLGVFNLLPIPILDGGVILLLLVEGFMRRDLSVRFKERFVQVGIVFLLILAVFVVYNDIMKTLNIS